MLRVPRGRIDGLLQIMTGMDVAKQKLACPLILLIAPRRAPDEIGFAVP
jgi:hypothetical protein